MARGPKLGRRGLIVAAVTAAGVLATVLIQNALQALVSLAAFGTFDGFLFAVIEGAWTDALTTSLPLAVGVFLSLWQVAPIGAELRAGHVIARSVLATAVGSTIVFFVKVIVSIVATIASAVSNVATVDLFDVTAFGSGIGLAGATALVTLIASVPLVVLAGILLWLWLRSHDRKYSVEGMLDL